MLLAAQIEKKTRLDLFISKELEWSSRSAVQKWIADGCVSVNGKIVSKTGYAVENGDSIEIQIPEKDEITLIPEEIPLSIVYEDEYLVVINKPAGLVVHPGAGVQSGTLVNALLHHFKSLSSVDATRPGIVHRLDKDTSGLMIVAKDDIAHRKLSDMLKERTVKRVYMGILVGKFEKTSGNIIAPIGRNEDDRKKMAVNVRGRYAETKYTVLEIFRGYSLVEFSLKTGRTHQIRVHSKFAGHPILGDITYGGKATDKKLACVNRQMLHAQKLSFHHPVSGEFLQFETVLPEDFQHTLNVLYEQFS